MTKHRIFRILIAVLVALIAAPAFAGPTCDKGDYADGPNCISMVEVWSPVKHSPRYRSTVYRKAGNVKKVVWEGRGGVVESTAKKIEVVRWVVTDENETVAVVVTFVWSQVQSKYVAK